MSGGFLEEKTGPRGPAGLAGLPGADGPPGPRGASGAPGLPGPAVPGPPGPDGEPGVQGGQGPDGPDGKTGDTGAQGTTGDTGQKGPDGDPGATGPTGPAGARKPFEIQFVAINTSLVTIPDGPLTTGVLFGLQGSLTGVNVTAFPANQTAVIGFVPSVIPAQPRSYSLLVRFLAPGTITGAWTLRLICIVYNQSTSLQSQELTDYPVSISSWSAGDTLIFRGTFGLTINSVSTMYCIVSSASTGSTPEIPVDLALVTSFD